MMMTTVISPNHTNVVKDEKYELASLRTATVTNTAGNLATSLDPALVNKSKTSYGGSVDIKNDANMHFTNIITNTIENLKKMLGFTPPCLNGGMKTLRGECICPKFFRGPVCGEMVCINNGTLERVRERNSTQYSCRCPNPEYIHGHHCEHVRCLNGGRPMDNGQCKCLDYWYTGQFCEEYAASWGVVLGLPLLCIVIAIICCVICRLDLFPRKPERSRRRGGTSLNGVYDEGINHRRRGLELRRGNNRTCSEINLRMQGNLLNDNSGEPLVLRPCNYFLSSYVIQLDTISALNPNVTTNGNLLKAFDPPPSYEEAVATFSAAQQLANGTRTCGTVPPPEYSTDPRPSRSRIQSSNVSRNS